MAGLDAMQAEEGIEANRNARRARPMLRRAQGCARNYNVLRRILGVTSNTTLRRQESEGMNPGHSGHVLVQLHISPLLDTLDRNSSTLGPRNRDGGHGPSQYNQLRAMGGSHAGRPIQRSFVHYYVVFAGRLGATANRSAKVRGSRHRRDTLHPTASSASFISSPGWPRHSDP